jgi:hypothetical protein
VAKKEGFPWRVLLAISLAVTAPFVPDLPGFPRLSMQRFLCYLVAMGMALATLTFGWIEGSKRGFAPQLRATDRRARTAALRDVREAILALIERPQTTEESRTAGEIRGMGKALEAVSDLQNFPAPQVHESPLLVQQFGKGNQ